MKFSRRLNSVHSSVGRLLAAPHDQQAINDQEILAVNASRDGIYAWQSHDIPEPLYMRFRQGYQVEQTLNNLFAIHELITEEKKNAQ